MSGFDPNTFIDKPSDDFSCPICLGVLNDPLQCPQGHAFCRGCITNWLCDHATCPVGKCHLDRASMSTSLIVRNLIGKMVVYCPHSNRVATGAVGVVAQERGKNEEGCQWRGALDCRKTHLKGECEYTITTSCSNIGCSTTAARGSMAAHDAVCQHKIIECAHEGCGKELIRRDMLIHDGFCPQKASTCCLCDSVVKRKNMEEHYNKVLCRHH